MKKKIITLLTLSAVFVGSISFGEKTKFARATEATEDTITLGDFDNISGKFSEATATEINTYQTAIVSLAGDIEGLESIILPEVDGFTLNESASSSYSKVIFSTEPLTAKEFIEEYVSNIVFNNCGMQSLSVTLNNENIENVVGYFSDTQHYYMYVPDITKTWTDAYDAARQMEYMGRKGYLATVTSFEEDAFICKITEKDGNKQVGWLGGTIMTPTSALTEDNYYNSFSKTTSEKVEQKVNNVGDGTYKDSELNDYWYWACGPEAGEQFFNRQTVSKTSTARSDEIYAENKNSGYYFNWNVNYSKAEECEPNSNSPIENCLSTLTYGNGYSTKSTIYGYSWNNINEHNCGAGTWSAHGYVVEFGDLLIGDTHSEVASSYVATSKSFNNYIEWTNPNSLPTEAGLYILKTDVIMPETWVTPEGYTELRMEGHLIQGPGFYSTILVPESSALSLVNYDDITEHPGYTDSDLLWHSDPTDSHIEGDGETDEKVYGAVITGAETGINVFGDLKLTGINISGNAGEDGAGIYVNEGAHCEIHDARVSYNTGTNGSGIYNLGDLEMYNTTVNYNKTTGNGGVYHGSQTPLTLGGEIMITTYEDNGISDNCDLFIDDGSMLLMSDENPIDVYETNVFMQCVNNNQFICEHIDNWDLFYYFNYIFFSTNPETGFVLDGLPNDFSILSGESFTLNFLKDADNFESNHGCIYEQSYAISAVVGSMVTIEIESDAGYMLKPNSFTISGEDLQVIQTFEINKTNGCTYQYRFVMPSEDVDLDCEFVTYVFRTENVITSFSISDYTYGEEPEEIIFEAEYGQDNVIYCSQDEITGSYSIGLPTEAGYYTVYAIISGTNEYEFVMDGYYIEVAQAENEIISLEIEDWECGETPSIPTINAKFGTPEYTYSTEEDGTYTSTVPTAAGRYYLKAVIEETNNYSEASKIVSFEIKEGETPLPPTPPGPTPTPQGGESEKVVNLLWLIIVLSILDLIGVGGIFYFKKEIKEEAKFNEPHTKEKKAEVSKEKVKTETKKEPTKMNSVALFGLLFIPWQLVTVIILAVILIGLVVVNILLFRKYKKEIKKDE